MDRTMPKVVILLGPPGAGKGTHADLLADRFGFFHFETAKIVEEELRTHGDDEILTIDGETYRYGDERRNFHSGILVEPKVIAYWVASKIRELAATQKPLVFSGSPRTLFEAKMLVPLLEELYGRGAMRVVLISIPEAESVLRNSHRRICEQCRATVPFFPETAGLTACPRCGGRLVRRGALDTPDVIRVRLREYVERTAPIIDFLRMRGVAVQTISGFGTIEDVAQRLQAALHDHDDAT